MVSAGGGGRPWQRLDVESAVSRTRCSVVDADEGARRRFRLAVAVDWVGAEARVGWAVLSASVVKSAARLAAAIEVELACGEGG